MNIQNLTIYMGSGGKAPKIFQHAAQHLGKITAEQDINIVYGGMEAGLMGIVANSALAAGGKVLGIIPTNIKDQDFVHQGLLDSGDMIVVDNMWERKKLLVDHGDAAIAMPGGYGTLDEIFEFLYWGSKGFHNKAIGLLNIEEYWTPMLAFIAECCERGDLDPSIYNRLFIDKDFQYLLHKLESYVPDNEESVVAGKRTEISLIEEDNLRKTSEPIVIKETNIENLYRLANALVLKQLGKVVRPIGVLDEERIFGKLRLWIYTAASNRFITPYCPDMACFAETPALLNEMLKNHIHVSVDLHEKWEGIPDNKRLRKDG